MSRPSPTQVELIKAVADLVAANDGKPVAGGDLPLVRVRTLDSCLGRGWLTRDTSQHPYRWDVGVEGYNAISPYRCAWEDHHPHVGDCGPRPF